MRRNLALLLLPASLPAQEAVSFDLLAEGYPTVWEYAFGWFVGMAICCAGGIALKSLLQTYRDQLSWFKLRYQFPTWVLTLSVAGLIPQSEIVAGIVFLVNVPVLLIVLPFALMGGAFGECMAILAGAAGCWFGWHAVVRLVEWWLFRPRYITLSLTERRSDQP